MTDKVTSEKNKTTRRIKKTVLKLWKITCLVALTFQQIYCIIVKDKDSIFSVLEEERVEKREI